VIRQIELASGARLRVSPKGGCFPGTKERTCVATGTFFAVKDCTHALMDRVHSRKNGKDRVLTRLSVPRSAVSSLIGRNGTTMKSMCERSHCVITISPTVENFSERLVSIAGPLENSKRAALEVLSRIRNDPHVHENTQIEYDVSLPPDAWDAHAGHPVNEDRLLIRPEDVDKYEKRELVEYLREAAPRKIVLEYRLLGDIKNVVKARSTTELRRAVKKTLQKTAVGYPFVEGDILWTWPAFRLYCFITFVAGVVAGLIGIGGGMVLGPMMLQLGVLPQVSAATTATMIVLTSSSAALVFVTGGLVPPTTLRRSSGSLVRP